MAQKQAIRLVVAAVGLLVLFGMAGCSTGSAAPSPSPIAATVALMEKVPGVVKVEDRDLSTTVVVAVDASDGTVLDAASAIDRIAAEASWEGPITLSRDLIDPHDDELDVTRFPPWSLVIFPAEGDRVSTELAGILSLEKIEGASNVTVIDGWPYVTLTSIDSFAADFRTIAALPAFEHGGTVSLYADERLRIVWVPERTSLDAVDAIVRISVDFPDAEVLLQATTAGPQWPTLYVARLSTEQAAEIEQRLLDPALADADSDGYALPFMLTVIGSDGPVYTEGSFGGVVE